LAAALAAARLEAEQEDKPEYMAVLMQGKKVGHAVLTRSVVDGKVSTEMKAEYTLFRMGVPLKSHVESSFVETADGKVVSFKVIRRLGTADMTTEGTIDADGKLQIKRTSSGKETTETMDWPEGAMGPEGLRLQLLQKNLKEGTTYKVALFEPSILKAVEANVEVGARQKVDLLGRVVELTEVKSIMNLPPAGEITTTTYVGDDMKALKIIIPIMGMKLEMIACTEEVALSEVEPTDFFDKLILKSPKPIEGIRQAKAATYQLAPTDAKELDMPQSDNQKVKAGPDGTVIVEVRPAEPPAGAKLPYEGDDKTALEALKPSRYVESDREEVIALARKAVGDAKDAALAVRRIEKFVGEYIDNKSLSVGYATAAEVLAGREGDCSEHAVLVSALCRAAGIPSQVVCGLVYVEESGELKDIFGPHAWARAYVGGKWVGLDAAMPDGYGAGHITLSTGNGDPEGFFGMITRLGRFEIKQVSIER
jgi:hypothetical protein